MVLDLEGAFERIRLDFEKRSGLRGLPYSIRDRPTSATLVLEVLHPTERLFGALDAALKAFPLHGEKVLTATLKRRQDSLILRAPETRLLVKTLAESRTADRHSFGDDFFGRYTRSLFGAEEQVTARSNNVVFGRRGSGKSSLLLYALHSREAGGEPSVWVDMQVYAQREDEAVIVDVLSEIVSQTWGLVTTNLFAPGIRDKLSELKRRGDQVTLREIREVLPDIKRLFATLQQAPSDFFVFLDDFHVIGRTLQPLLLDILYAFCRGNRVFLKISAIETLTRLWEATTRRGLEVPHDAQVLRLDYNLTNPQMATEHITKILDGHANYCGLPSVRLLCSENDVLSRLVWVAAGVPRDSISIFSRAITAAAQEGKKRVTVTNVNVAAAEVVADKLRDIEIDTTGSFDEANELLAEIKDFCLRKKKHNAFVVEIAHDDKTYTLVRELVDLRLLHVIHDGITRHRADRRYIALILDYGFYIGVRAAKSIDLFNKSVGMPTFAELRAIPVFSRTDPPSAVPKEKL